MACAANNTYDLDSYCVCVTAEMTTTLVGALLALTGTASIADKTL